MGWVLKRWGAVGHEGWGGSCCGWVMEGCVMQGWGGS